MTSSLQSLLSSYQLNTTLTLKNRIVMAPMTRCMADDGLVPTNAMAEYYGRRSAAGLIISEGTIISPSGLGYSHTPGIYTQDQIKAWTKVTDKVHQQGGHIFLQIWHTGRVSHPSFINGQLPISASSTQMSGRIPRTKDLNYGQSRAASLDEIKQLIDQYAVAAQNAIAAGFDGVEIHGANGYLIDQFLHYTTNHREDIYGGSPENMARFALEVIQAVCDAIGHEKVGLRISPVGYLNQIAGQSSDTRVFEYLLKELNPLQLAYVHTGNFDDRVTFPALDNLTMSAFIRKHYDGTLIACGSYSFEQAETAIEDGKFDLLGVGRSFIANPDLVHRLKENTALKAYNEDMLQTLY